MATADVTSATEARANGHATAAKESRRNAGIALDLAWVREARFTNRSAMERRAATPGRSATRSVPSKTRAAKRT